MKDKWHSLPLVMAGTLFFAGCGLSASLMPDTGSFLNPPVVNNPQAPLYSVLEFEIDASIQSKATVNDVKYLTIIVQPEGAASIKKTVSYSGQKVRFDNLAAGKTVITVNALDAYKRTIGTGTKTVTIKAGTSVRIPISFSLSGSGEQLRVVIIGDSNVTPLPSPTPTPSPTRTPTSGSTPAPTPTPVYPTPAPISNTSGYGPKSNYAPSYDVLVQPGQLTQTLVSSKAEGTRFALAAGVHRIPGTLSPKRSQQFLGLPGAIINGSKVLTGWVQDGTRWYVTGQTQRMPQLNASDLTTPESPMANKGEDVFFDNNSLFQVDALSKLAPGKFYFDYTNNRIYVADNPSGHTVETTAIAQAFNGGGTDVLIKNLVIEKFGSRAQIGAIHTSMSGWKVEDCEVRLNHGVGIHLEANGVVRGSSIHHQGQLGLGGSGSNLLIENNEISYNNAAGYNSYWEAGGTKWCFTTGLIVRNNYSHHNAGPGLWTDIDNHTSLYENNRVEQNERSGIMHEISYDAIIRNNTIRNNGTAYKYWEVEGAGINITRSQGVEAYGNTIEGNAAGVVLCHDQRTDSDTKNNNIHDNNIQMGKGYTGALLAGGQSDTSVFTSKNNRFTNNHYRVTNLSGNYWEWNGSKNWTQWKAQGQDTGGSLAAN